MASSSDVKPEGTRCAAQTTCPHPGVVGARVRVLSLVDHDVLHVVFIADVGSELLKLFEARSVGGLANRILVEGQ